MHSFWSRSTINKPARADRFIPPPCARTHKKWKNSPLVWQALLKGYIYKQTSGLSVNLQLQFPYSCTHHTPPIWSAHTLLCYRFHLSFLRFEEIQTVTHRMEALVRLDERHTDYWGSDLSSLSKCSGTAFTNTRVGGEERDGRRSSTQTLGDTQEPSTSSRTSRGGIVDILG